MKADQGPAIQCIAIGSELLSADRLDTNTHEIQGMLLEAGLRVRRCALVDDDAGEIARAVKTAAASSDAVICTGGLGPTADDVTREGVADAAGVPLVEDAAALADIEAFFRTRGRGIAASNRRQALIPEGGEKLTNPLGTAPGFVKAVRGTPVYCLPGVPSEMRALMKDGVVPRLLSGLAARPARIVQARVHIAGITESSVNDQIEEVLSTPGLLVSIMAHQSTITIKLTAEGEGAQALVDASKKKLGSIFGDRIFSEGEVQRMEEVVGKLLIERGITLGLAESCTGGLAGHLMTDVPGISAVFLEGAVAYSVEAKKRTLKVPEKVIEEHGQVSREVAKAMAKGIAERAGARAGIGITGIAGPGGGTVEKPVGTVHMAVFLDGELRDRKYVFGGDRDMIKMRSARLALDLLRRAVLGLPDQRT
jgi:nicotinamide-nucleotide amidase